MKRFWSPWNILGLLVLLIGVAVYIVGSPRLKSSVANFPNTVEEAALPQQVELRLYFAKNDASGFLIEKRKVTLEPGESVYQKALDELIAGPAQGGAAIVPEGFPSPTVFVHGKIAYVDLPDEYAHLGYGTTGETLLVYGMAYTLLDQGPVEEVRFLLKGQPATTLGHLSLLEPIRRP